MGGVETYSRREVLGFFLTVSNYKRKDHLYNQAKDEGYRSRAAYKLIEIDEKFRLFKNSSKVIDLGCAPGSWLQVTTEKVSAEGLVIGVDRLATKPFSLVEMRACSARCGHKIVSVPIILVGDILDSQIQAQLIGLAHGKVDLLLSDMSPDLSGVYFKDSVNSAELVEIVFQLAQVVLKPGGAIVTKIFPSNEADEIFKSMQQRWTKLSRVALKATRTTSKEIYFVGIGFKG